MFVLKSENAEKMSRFLFVSVENSAKSERNIDKRANGEYTEFTKK